MILVPFLFRVSGCFTDSKLARTFKNMLGVLREIAIVLDKRQVTVSVIRGFTGSYSDFSGDFLCIYARIKKELVDYPSSSAAQDIPPLYTIQSGRSE